MGNVLSFMVAALMCDRLVLRVEDLDPQRSKQQHIDQLFRDLDYLGFEWDGLVSYQSERTEAYQRAFDSLCERELLYPCFCTRADLHNANAPHFGEEVVYANTCRNLSGSELKEAWARSRQTGMKAPSWRLKVEDRIDAFEDGFQGFQEWNLSQSSGDFIIRRSDGVFAYQLAVVVDDAAVGVSSVVRGVDLLSSVPRQRYLQRLLGFRMPSVAHVPLLVDDQGRRLSKRNGDTTLGYLIDQRGLSGREILGHLAWLAGIIPEYQPASLDELRKLAKLSSLKGKRTLVWRNPFVGNHSL